ncbi:MAG: tRNA (5-methylaminomethyl-2-thiouridine)(34)-methyltransferase MnmD [Bacteroidota bacterium]|nr:tRNA (5-methylaminomethyl-2-thiouridine)(34)-methyltransferase MnmD [Bacteroidota bacterium]
MPEVKIIQTDDGSHSLYLPELKETYHSFHGAIQESIYVYINKGFNYLLQHANLMEINILEVGFGTGLNILLTIAEAQKARIKISITTLEPFQLAADITERLNYHELLNPRYPTQDLEHYFQLMHRSPWNEQVKITEYVLLTKKAVKLQEFSESGENFDLVYFDAFAPSKQPEIWQSSIFQNFFNNINKGGIIVTYCAQGQFKRNLKMAGFEVETLAGPPGKKEMVRGKKI